MAHYASAACALAGGRGGRGRETEVLVVVAGGLECEELR